MNKKIVAFSSYAILRLGLLPSVILFRATLPLVPQTLPNLSNKHIFLSSGLQLITEAANVTVSVIGTLGGKYSDSVPFVGSGVVLIHSFSR